MNPNRMKIPLALFVAAVFAFFFFHCAGDDNSSPGEDSSQETDDDSGGPDDDSLLPDDDDSVQDDDNDDFADDDDDDDDDSGSDQQIVYDDGQPESGLSALCGGCALVQGFTPPTYPAVILGVDVYTDTDAGVENEIRLNIYYESNKAGEPVQIVYQTAPLTVDTADGWNTIDLSQAQTLQNFPILSGTIWIGFAYEIDGGNGPYIGYDYQGAPGNEIWYYSLFEEDWTRLIDYDYGGVLMVRPTLRPIPA